MILFSDLLPAHAFGCDTVACYFGLGKGAVIKTLRTEFHFEHYGISNACMENVIAEASKFILCCYGMKKALSMSISTVPPFLTGSQPFK